MKAININISTRTVVILFFVLFPVSIFAQFNLEKKADQYFDDFAYSKAAEIYEKLYQDGDNNPKLIQRLAYSYNKMLSYPKALSYFGKLVLLDNHKPEDYYEYAQLLRITGNTEESKKWLEKYIVTSPGDQRAKKQLESINSLLDIKGNMQNIVVQNMEGNSLYTDMCAAFYKDRVVYSSARDSFSMVRNKFVWNNQPFLDLYVTEPGKTDISQADKHFSSSVNSRLHEGPVCFTTDYNTIYFTRNNLFNGKMGRTSEGVNNLKIFIADFDGKDWKNLRELPFNSNNYSVGHPALSADNKTLYFVSDMPGGFGETDIYKSVWTGASWGKPLNLGESINTKGKEMFPYVDKDGILYFASDGQPGKGGLDIFAAKDDGSGNYVVVNLGNAINSQYDDFCLVMNNETLTGYFSSNRPGGKGADDIYSVRINKIDLKVVAYDSQSKLPVPEAKVALLDSNGKPIESKIADKSGSVDFLVSPGEKYQLLAEDKTYVSEKKDVNISGSLFDFVKEENIFLKQAVPYLTIEVIDKESGLIIPNALVDITQGKYNESELEDNNGIIKMKLMESTDYTFNTTAEEYFDKEATFTTKGKTAGEYSLTIEMEKLSIGKQFVLEDLFYDLNKYNIRPDAAVVLDKLAKILVDNPNIRVEIGSHTDSRGASDANMKLSQNRSESVVAYLIGKGITKSRLVAKGYGESQLVNKCADGVPCTEVEHQANRRTVIEILNPEIRRVKRGTKNVYYF